MIIEWWGGPLDGDVFEAEDYTMEEHLQTPGIFVVNNGKYLFTLIDDIIVAVYKED